jgi:hypothetical protein
MPILQPTPATTGGRHPGTRRRFGLSQSGYRVVQERDWPNQRLCESGADKRSTGRGASYHFDCSSRGGSFCNRRRRATLCVRIVSIKTMEGYPLSWGELHPIWIVRLKDVSRCMPTYCIDATLNCYIVHSFNSKDLVTQETPRAKRIQPLQ